MKPRQKCVSLDTARKLKEAGFPQETERCYTAEGVLLNGGEVTSAILGTEIGFAAPDAQEIGELLPSEVEGDCWLYALKDSRNGWWVGYCAYGEDPAGRVGEKYAGWSVNEAEARAKAWLWLKENGMV